MLPALLSVHRCFLTLKWPGSSTVRWSFIFEFVSVLCLGQLLSCSPFNVMFVQHFIYNTYMEHRLYGPHSASKKKCTRSFRHLPFSISLSATESLYAKTILCIQIERLTSSHRGNPKHIHHNHHDNQG